MTKTKPSHTLVTGASHLEDLLRENGEIELKLMLNAGLFSRKTVRKLSENEYQIFHHIDDTDEIYGTIQELCQSTNLGKGFDNYAVFYEND